MKKDDERIGIDFSDPVNRIKYADFDLNNPKKVQAAILTGHYIPWERVALQIRNDDETMLLAVKSNGLLLSYASDRIKNNPQIVAYALKNCSGAWGSVSDELKNNDKFKKQICKEALNVRYALDKTMKLKDIPMECFADKAFYNDIVNSTWDRVLEEFGADEEYNSKIEKKARLKVKAIQAELTIRRNIALAKSTITEKIDKITHKNEESFGV